MEDRIDVITLAVGDLERALGFYRDGLGLESPGITGTQFEGDDTTPAGAVVMFRLDSGLIWRSTHAVSSPRTPTSRPDRRGAASSALATS